MNDDEFRLLQEEKLKNQRLLIEGVNALNMVMVKIDTKIDVQGKTLQDIRKYNRTTNKETGILCEKVDCLEKRIGEDSTRTHKRTKWWIYVVIVALGLLAGETGLGIILKLFVGL